MSPRSEQRTDADSSSKITAAVRHSARLIYLVRRPIKVEIPQSGAIDPENWSLVGPAMVFSAASCLRSLMHLATASNRRREQDAIVLLRRIFEYAVDFSWIAINPAEHLKRWTADYYAHRVKLEDELLGLGRSSIAPEVRADYERRADAIKKRLPNVLQKTESADGHWSKLIEEHGTFPKSGRAAGTEGKSADNGIISFRGAYALIYRGGSAHAHPTSMSIHSYVQGKGKDGEFAIGFDSDYLSEEDRHAYTLGPLIFAPMLLVSKIAQGWPETGPVYASFQE